MSKFQSLLAAAALTVIPAAGAWAEGLPEAPSREREEH